MGLQAGTRRRRRAGVVVSSKPKKPAGPIERLARRVVLGTEEQRKPLTDQEIRDGVQPKDGDRDE